MKALILAGGLGTRLRPLTLARPKHLLPIANRPHIDHVFEWLHRHDVDEVVLLTSYLAERFTEAVARASTKGLRVEVTHERQPLGTAGALKNAESYVGGDTFLAFNGDVLSDIDLGAAIDWHRSREAEATIVLTPVADPSAYGVVSTDSEDQVLGFIEKPPREEAPTNLVNAGVYVLEPSVLSRIPRRGRFGRATAVSPAGQGRRAALRVRYERLLDGHRDTGQVSAGEPRRAGRPVQHHRGEDAGRSGRAVG